MSAYEQWIAFLTIMRKEVRRYLRIWTQTLLPSAITMSLYFLIFGTLIGKRIGTMGGVSYMEFVVPGLIMMAIITNSYANVVGSFFGAKFNNSIEELLVSPTPNYVIVLGYAAGGVSRGILVSIIVTSVALFFTKLDIHSWFVVGQRRRADVDCFFIVWADQRSVCQYVRRRKYCPDVHIDTIDVLGRCVLFARFTARFLGEHFAD
jgi:hypothetical protein